MPLPVGGTVVIRMKFAEFTGKFVFHCHILNHEDHGMMAIVEVVEPKKKKRRPECPRPPGAAARGRVRRRPRRAVAAALGPRPAVPAARRAGRPHGHSLTVSTSVPDSSR